jgi:hypothetical protein
VQISLVGREEHLGKKGIVWKCSGQYGKANRSIGIEEG